MMAASRTCTRLMSGSGTTPPAQRVSSGYCCGRHRRGGAVAAVVHPLTTGIPKHHPHIRLHTSSCATAAHASSSAAPSTSGRDDAHLSILVEEFGLSADEAAPLAPSLAAIEPSALSQRAAALRARFKRRHVIYLAVHAPGVLQLDVPAWIEFLDVCLVWVWVGFEGCSSPVLGAAWSGAVSRL